MLNRDELHVAIGAELLRRFSIAIFRGLLRLVCLLLQQHPTSCQSRFVKTSTSRLLIGTCLPVPLTAETYRLGGIAFHVSTPALDTSQSNTVDGLRFGSTHAEV